MKRPSFLQNSYEDRVKRQIQRLRWYSIHLDPYLILAVAVLNFFALLVLYSASDSNLHMLYRQETRFAIGCVLMIIIAQIPPNLFKISAKWLYGFSLLLIIGVLIVGKLGGGAQRWLSLGMMSFQPSELMKIALPISLAAYLSDNHWPPSSQTAFICLVLIVVPCLFILVEPDLGTAIITALSSLLILTLAGLSRRFYIWSISAGLLSAPFIWHHLHNYQKQRILTFLDPGRNPLGAGYHILQSEIAVGSGGALGKGWLQGTQSHLQFLPTHTTDFIFSVIGEELGLLGAVLLLTIYIIIWLRCLYLSHKVTDPFARILSAGLSFVIILSAIINIGMTIGIIPVVGVPLPLVSYGGSAMMIHLIIFGMIMSLTTNQRPSQAATGIQ